MSKWKLKRQYLHNLVMGHITDDIWNKWCLITFATYKNNYKDKETSRSYCYTLSHSWESDGEYNLWLYIARNKADIAFYKIDDNGNEQEISHYSTSLYLDSDSYVSLSKYLCEILDSEQKKESDKQWKNWG